MNSILSIQVINQQHQIVINGLPVSDLLGSLSFVILSITLLASLRAVRESARANILGHLPILTLSHDYDSDDIKITNSGTGTAVNIKVDSFYQWWADSQFKLYGLTRMKFDKVSLLKPGESISTSVRFNGGPDPLGLMKFTMFSAQDRPLVFAAIFSDLSGRRFVTKVRIHKGVVKVIKFPKQLTALERLLLGFMRIKDGVQYVYFFSRVHLKQWNDSKRG